MSRRSDRFKKILPTDMPRRGLDVTVSTRSSAVERGVEQFPDYPAGTARPPNFEVGAVQGDSVGAAHPRANKGLVERNLLAERAKDFAERRKKQKPKKRITHTLFRIKLDFMIRVDGDQVMPDAFGPKYMNFIAAGLRATMLQEPTYAEGDLTVDVLPGSVLNLRMKHIKEK